MKKKLFLLDAMALIYRAYYALVRSPRITSNGRNTNAQFGFTNTLIDIINKEKPDILVCGHSHIVKVMKDPKYNFLHINSGAAGIHGFHKMRTIIRFEIDNGKPQKMELIEYLKTL